MTHLRTIHVRLNDPRTNKPAPCWVNILDSQQREYFPLSRTTRFPTGRAELVGGVLFEHGKRWFVNDGSFEILLPVEENLQISCNRGPHAPVLQQEMVIAPGQMTIRLTLPEPLPVSDEYCQVDARAHFVSPGYAALEGAAVGLDLVHLLITPADFPSPDGHLYETAVNTESFSGQAIAHSHENCQVVVNTLNTHTMRGRLGLLYCHRQVHPLSFGYLEDTDDWTLSDWRDQCHRKHGMAVWVDAYRAEKGLPGGEALALAVLGKIDALEFDEQPRQVSLLPHWYRLLNAGINLPIVGSSGKDSNRTAVGSFRTLTPKLPEFSHRTWTQQILTGQAVITRGPILQANINGQPFSSQLHLEASTVLHFGATVHSPTPGGTLEWLHQGKVIHKAIISEPLTKVDFQLEQHQSGWYAARIIDPSMREKSLIAHTAPCRVQVGEQGLPISKPATESCISEINATIEWVKTYGRFQQERNRTVILETCQAALDVLDRNIAIL
ncbi:MAG: hypothetical protein R3B84_10945 [Zavarzinella sp.]